MNSKLSSTIGKKCLLDAVWSIMRMRIDESRCVHSSSNSYLGENIIIIIERVPIFKVGVLASSTTIKANCIHIVFVKTS